MIKKLCCSILRWAALRSMRKGDKNSARAFAALYGITVLLGVGELWATTIPAIVTQVRSGLRRKHGSRKEG